MKFAAHFLPGDDVEEDSSGYERAISLPERVLGTEDVATVREKLGDVPLRKIKCKVNRLLQNITVDVTEEEAATIPHFRKNCDAYVHLTSSGALNRFSEEVVAAKRDEITGEIEEAYITYIVDERAIFEAWREAGYPAVW
jgi:hypothetical protein